MQAVRDLSEDRCPRIAAALAYSTAFSLAPTLILVVSICQLVFDPEDVRGQVEREVVATVGVDGANQIKSILDADEGNETQSKFATLASLGLMVVGATGLFVQVQGALNDVWEVQPDPQQGSVKTFLLKRIASLGMLLTIAFLLIVSLS